MVAPGFLKNPGVIHWLGGAEPAWDPAHVREHERVAAGTEDILAMLRQVDALTSQGLTVADAPRSIGLTEVTYRKWRSEYGGLIRILGPTPE